MTDSLNKIHDELNAEGLVQDPQVCRQIESFLSATKEATLNEEFEENVSDDPNIGKNPDSRLKSQEVEYGTKGFNIAAIGDWGCNSNTQAPLIV
jgi:hypothetical protein